MVVDMVNTARTRRRDEGVCRRPRLPRRRHLVASIMTTTTGPRQPMTLVY